MPRKLIYALSVVLICCTNLFAQVDGDYRTNVVSVFGSWSDAAIWERFDGVSGTWVPAGTSPSFSDNVITISTGDSVQITNGATFTIDQVVVATGASLIVFATPLTQTVILNDGTGDDISVDGRFYIASGGTLTTAGLAKIRVNASGYMQIRNGGVSGVNVDNYGLLEVNRFTINNNCIVSNYNNMAFIDADPVAALAVSIDNASLINSGTILIQTTASIFIQGVSGTNTINNQSNGVITKTTNSGTFATVNGGTGVDVTNAGLIDGFGPFLFDQSVGSFNNTGTISPGIASSVSIMTANNAILKPTGTVSVQIGNTNTPGTGHDQVSISSGGVTTLAGNLVVSEFSPAAPLGIYTIMTTAGSFAGNFATVNKPLNYSSPIIVGNTVQIEKLSLTLPVEWGGIAAATINDKDVSLNWSTLQETNTTHYVIEHCDDGKLFLPLGQVEAAGNSSVKVNYSFIHRNANTRGSNYYRIKQYDQDGKFSYSRIVTASFTSRIQHAVEILENPVRNSLKLRVLESGITLVIFQSNGTILKKISTPMGFRAISVDNLSQGVYQIAIYKGNKIIGNKKFIIAD